jgi:hypothetical protein
VCAFLLHLLNIHCGTKFVVSDEHSNVSACALPEWLPGKVVRLMVQEFSGRLREELDKLADSNNQRARVRTSDTGQLSMGSIRSLKHEPIPDWHEDVNAAFKTMKDIRNSELSSSTSQ